MNGPLPKTDLRQLRQDVVTEGPKVALPSHLSDYWLELISLDLECLVGIDAEMTLLNRTLRYVMTLMTTIPPMG